MRTFSRVSALSLVTAAALLSAGCLQKETTHTLYLSPGGAVAWLAVEKDIRSDEADAAKRAAEEHDYALAADAGQQPVAAALRRLGARSASTTWLRRDRPFIVVTEGRFTDIRQLTLAILRDAGVEGDASLVTAGCRTTLTVRVNVDAGSSATGDSALDALLADPDGYRLVLTRGRFLSADGFVIQDDGAVATPDAHTSPVDGIVTLTLTWIDEGC